MVSVPAQGRSLRLLDSGLLPVPLILIAVYGFLLYPFNVVTLCGRVPEMRELWSLPWRLGMSFAGLFTTVNLLFAAYLAVHLWSVLTGERARSARKLVRCALLLAAGIVLVFIQSWVNRAEALLGLPDEIVELRMTEFRELVHRREMEDVSLPVLDSGRGFGGTSPERIIVHVNRHGEFIHSRRNQGRVTDRPDRVRRFLKAEAACFGRDGSGRSTAPLLIRADRDARFGDVLKVIRFCGEPDIGIGRIEIGCDVRLASLAPEAAEKVAWPGYWLPEGKIDLPIASDPSPDWPTIEVTCDGREKAGPAVHFDGKTFEGRDGMKGLGAALKRPLAGGSGTGVVIRLGENVRHGDVALAWGACLAAGAETVSFIGE